MTVVMYRVEYTENYDYVLHARTKFEKYSFNKDRSQKLEEKILNLLSTLCLTNVSDIQTVNQLKPWGEQIPRLYGLP